MKEQIISSNLEDGELDLINQYSRKPLTEDEVYVFSMVLCDNEIDKDYEVFTAESLEQLGRLLLGKTGFLDSSGSISQTARIISCTIESIEDKKTRSGEDYIRLSARAYMPKTTYNKELRDTIDNGDIKEVSVGCAVEKTICSICGKDINSSKCLHIKGNTYNDKLCYGKLINPTDAYEFAFVPQVETMRKLDDINESTKDAEEFKMVTMAEVEEKFGCKVAIID